MQFLKETTQGIVLKVFVQPRSAKNMIAGQHGDALKIKLTAPPVDGAANKMCIQYLAKFLKVPKSTIEIISGHSSRTKRLLLRYDNEKNGGGSEQKRIRSVIASVLNLTKTT
ncbi:MAG: DUF167 domain-containing protein [Desulfobacterales bacterium]